MYTKYFSLIRETPCICRYVTSSRTNSSGGLDQTYMSSADRGNGARCQWLSPFPLFANWIGFLINMKICTFNFCLNKSFCLTYWWWRWRCVGGEGLSKYDFINFRARCRPTTPRTQWFVENLICIESTNGFYFFFRKERSCISFKLGAWNGWSLRSLGYE